MSVPTVNPGDRVIFTKATGEVYHNTKVVSQNGNAVVIDYVDAHGLKQRVTVAQHTSTVATVPAPPFWTTDAGL